MAFLLALLLPPNVLVWASVRTSNVVPGMFFSVQSVCSTWRLAESHQSNQLITTSSPTHGPRRAHTARSGFFELSHDATAQRCHGPNLKHFKVDSSKDRSAHSKEKGYCLVFKSTMRIRETWWAKTAVISTWIWLYFCHQISPCQCALLFYGGP
jgi:hypothetical protein